MQVKVLPMSRWKGNEQTLVLFAAEGQPAPLGWKGPEASLKRLTLLGKQEGFTGRAGQVVLLHPEKEDPARRVVLAGIGPLQNLTSEAYRRATAAAASAAAKANAKSVSVMFPERGEGAKQRGVAAAIAEGAILSQYRYTAYKTGHGEPAQVLDHVVILHGDDAPARDLTAGAAHGEISGHAACFARDLVNEPPSALNPQKLAERASKLGGRVRAKVHDTKTIERMNMGGLASVGRGGANPPVLIQLKYVGSKPKAKIALVGKGVTFDSGGLSLKPADSMETMKMDMAGAATVMAVMQAADKLKLPIQIDGYIPAAENMPSGTSLKPGDVIKMHNGRTVEVLNTDAEGRLLLADALAYAVKDKPDHVVDLATLTGAVIVALGSSVTGIMGTDRELVQAIAAAGDSTGEPMCALPLVKDYEEHLKSRVADFRNTHPRREAGAIMGGLFLKEFTAGASWAHLDIAGTAWTDKDRLYYPAGATGSPVRAILAWLVKIAGAAD